MAGRHRRVTSSKIPLRSTAASVVSVSLLMASVNVANAQPAPQAEPEGQTHFYDQGSDQLPTGQQRTSDAEVGDLTPEQRAVAEASVLNTLPDAPERAPLAGSLVSKEVASMMVDDRLWNANSYRIHYNSTDSLGNPSVDTAIYVEPKTPWAGKGPRPVVAIPPGTQGSAEY